MTYQFLSDEWFEKMNAIKDSMGEIKIAKEIQGLIVNFSLSNQDVSSSKKGDFCLNSGFLQQGHNQQAAINMTVPVNIAHKILLSFKPSAAITGIVTGKVKVAGDVKKLFALKMAKPTDTQMLFLKNVNDITHI